jgi:hypothetical protein
MSLHITTLSFLILRSLPKSDEQLARCGVEYMAFYGVQRTVVREMGGVRCSMGCGSVNPFAQFRSLRVLFSRTTSWSV